MAGVKLLPAVAWQLVQLVAPVWFIVVGVHAAKLVWQLPQALPVIGATVCALTPLVGRPVAAVPLWQVVQLAVPAIPAWLNEVGFHAVVVWQLAHCAYPAVEM